MLIAAIPKSASTSLMVTAGRVFGLPTLQEAVPDSGSPPELRFIHRWHSDIRVLSPGVVDRWTAKDIIHKQHVPPTQDNLALLSDYPVVALLRDPEQVVLAYRRGVRAMLHGRSMNEFAQQKTEADWLEEAERCGLLADLRDWNNGWRQCPGALVLDYRDVVQYPRGALDLISEYWGLQPPTGAVHLAKERYSRDRLAALVRRARWNAGNLRRSCISRLNFFQ